MTPRVGAPRRPALLMLALACAVLAAAGPRARAAGTDLEWARPVENRPGLPNLYQVSSKLYRGAQPQPEGFAELAAMGLGTVIDLRANHDEQALTDPHGLRLVRIPMRAWRTPREDDVVRFLRVVRDADDGPVFVHCRRGADRTGMVVAVYRVVVEGWSKDDALAEMIDGPFGHDRRWKKLARFVRTMDPDALRRAAGLAPQGR